MDRSMDSIGSCSLDVDADSSDISDTSDSLNFPTPLSVKDITREFTANIRERCTVRTTVVPQNTTAIVDPVSGQVRMVLTQPTSNSTEPSSALPPALGTAAAVIASNTGSVGGGGIGTNSPTAATTATSPTAGGGGSGGGGGGGGSGIGSGGEKKPSYLNLACCVNGYSNLTTYDSKIRQDINKSREVSPIRPSSQALQYCKKNNALAPPILHAMPNVSVTKQPLAGSAHIYNSTTVEASSGSTTSNGNGVHHENGNGNINSNGVYDHDERRNTSFIQQRVERLYGPGALAQTFYSPKKIRSASTLRAAETSPQSSELSRKFQELSPSKDYTEFRKKVGSGSAPNSARQVNSSGNCTTVEHTENNSIDLPCLRHLSQEFRAQLPTISPKRLVARSSPPRQDTETHDKPPSMNGVHVQERSENETLSTPLPRPDEVDHSVPHPLESLESIVAMPIKHSTSIEIQLTNPNENTQSQTEILAAKPAATAPSAIVEIPTTSTVIVAADCNKNGVAEKDGNYFLKLLKTEQARLLSLASDAEKYTDALANNPEITEDTLGFLRAASGKARLLVSQKMKQFEGLCHNNLNRSPEDKFPTTVDDLQGFWDMVHLQVDHIDSIFAEIEVLKSNDWKKPKAANDAIITPKSTPQHKSKTGNLRATKANGAVGGSASKAATPMSAAALKRESQRKQLLEMKRKNRLAMAATVTATATANDTTVESSATNLDNANSIEIFVEKSS